MAKREKLRRAYQKLKAGWTLNYGGALCYIAVCERHGSPSYGKEYIYWQHYGCSAESVSMKGFQFVLDVIFKVTDYDAYTLEN